MSLKFSDVLTLVILILTFTTVAGVTVLVLGQNVSGVLGFSILLTVLALILAVWEVLESS